MGKEVLITGANGFIGSHFTEFARQRQYTVFPGGREGACSTWPQIILDFASYGNYHNQKDIRKIYEANVTRLLELLHNTNHINYKAFVVTGSSSEYGQASIPMHEMMLPQPDSFYAAAKVAAVALAQTWAREMDKPVVSVRPFSVTGPGEQQQHLIPTLIRAAFSGEEVPFVPDPVHDFIDVRDFVEGVWKVVQRIDITKGQVINIGSGRQYSNDEVKAIVERITHRRINVRPAEQLRTYDKPLWVADNLRLRTLGWKQRFELEDTISDMIKAYGK